MSCHGHCELGICVCVCLRARMRVCVFSLSDEFGPLNYVIRWFYSIVTVVPGLI
uniref:Uncharacterized protein n=1 Tax=Anguilla anguilla TaxID=7936 RepID=A0A0E9WI37_ANGAN